MDFAAARIAVQEHLDDAYDGEVESPSVRGYGFDTGAAWAPLVAWAGAMGVYVYLVDKTTGVLSGLSFPAFDEMPDPLRVGPWPTNHLATIVNRSRERRSDG